MAVENIFLEPGTQKYAFFFFYHFAFDSVPKIKPINDTLNCLIIHSHF